MTDDAAGFDGGEIEVTEAEIAQELGPLVQPGKKAEVIKRVTTMMRRVHSGPLPAPDDLAQYSQIVPNGAERIMRMTEKEQDHRHKQEGRLVIGEYGTRILGQVGALMALAMLVSVVAFCAYIKQPIAAAVIAAMGAIVVAFLKHSAISVDRAATARPPQPRQRNKKK